jgi:pimeloyl-ACP methyl ester carboxylesterase
MAARVVGVTGSGMKHWREAAAALGGLMVGFSTWAIHVTEMPHHTIYVEAGGCRTPITVIEPDLDRPLGAAIMLHGLSANRKVMNYLGEELAFDGGLRVYALDFAGHGDNVAPFTFRRAEDCAAAAVAKLVENGTLNPKATAYVGHSMGAAIAIQMADRDPVAATVAISPGPAVLPKRMPANLLVFTGQFDPAFLSKSARDLQKAAGGDRTSAEDFLEQRAFLLDYVPRATHTSQLSRQQVEEDTRDWTLNSMEARSGNTDEVIDWKERVGWTAEQPPATLRSTLGKIWRAAVGAGSLWGIVGLFLIYPLWTMSAARFAGEQGGGGTDGADASAPGCLLLMLEWAVFAFAGVLLLMVFQPMRFVRLFTGGYLASLLLVVGILASAVNWKSFRENFRWESKTTVGAVVAAFGIFLSMGAWLNWQAYDAWMNGPRWLRFLEIVPAAWLFFYAEEILLGPVGAGGKRARRFGRFLLLRLILFGACAFGVFHLASGQILILLLVGGLALLSVLTRLGSDLLRQRTGSATAAALFGAILAAWFAAAVFPLT